MYAPDATGADALPAVLGVEEAGDGLWRLTVRWPDGAETAETVSARGAGAFGHMPLLSREAAPPGRDGSRLAAIDAVLTLAREFGDSARLYPSGSEVEQRWRAREDACVTAAERVGSVAEPVPDSPAPVAWRNDGIPASQPRLTEDRKVAAKWSRAAPVTPLYEPGSPALASRRPVGIPAPPWRVDVATLDALLRTMGDRSANPLEAATEALRLVPDMVADLFDAHETAAPGSTRATGGTEG